MFCPVIKTAFSHHLSALSTLSSALLPCFPSSSPFSPHPCLPLLSCLSLFGRRTGVAQVTRSMLSKQLKRCHGRLSSSLHLSLSYPLYSLLSLLLKMFPPLISYYWPLVPFSYPHHFRLDPFLFPLLFLLPSFFLFPSLCCTCCHIHLKAARLPSATRESRKQRGNLTRKKLTIRAQDLKKHLAKCFSVLLKAQGDSPSKYLSGA